jgi:small-conductance mechanosensitive channel
MPGPAPFLEHQILGNQMRAWIAAGAVFLVVFAALILLKLFVGRHLTKIARRTPNQIDDLVVDLLSRTRVLVMATLAMYAATLLLKVPDDKARLLRSVTAVVFLLQGALWGNRLITFWLTSYLSRRGEIDPAGRTTISTLGFVGRLLLWVTLLLLALDNLGIKVTGLITGLGIGGLAVALAAQEVLKDLFASLAIALDKPFLIGDAVTIGDFSGTVEFIGIKTTRIRSVNGEQIVIPNSDIIGSRLRNFGRMEERRVVLKLGLVYGTPAERVERAIEIVTEVVTAREGVRQDRVHFRDLGEFALSIEAVYFVTSADYRDYMDRQQEINLEILRRFAAEGIVFAYPTHTVILDRNGSGLPRPY